MIATNLAPQNEAPIERFVWDLTYACPLRCIHCYSESGRRPAAMLDRDQAMRVVDVIVAVKPQRISFGGGEPLLAPWWADVGRRLCDTGVPVTLFTSGWIGNDDIARELARSVAGVVVSIDGAKPETHDAIRGRYGSFDRAMATLAVLDRHKRDRAEPCYSLGIDYTVTKSNHAEIEAFVEDMTTRFPSLDFIRFGAVVPEGLAQEEDFAELLSWEQVVGLAEAEPHLAARAKNGARVSVTDSRYFLPSSPLSKSGDGIAHIEADGQMRAFTTYEKKVGNVLEEPIDVLWSRALAWRDDPFVREQRASIRTLADWARVARLLDRTYGSAADRARIARRSLLRNSTKGMDEQAGS